MPQQPPSPDDLIITLKPEATPEEEERFLAELAKVVLAIARHVVAREDSQSDGHTQPVE
jgi:hypothetical protein